MRKANTLTADGGQRVCLCRKLTMLVNHNVGIPVRIGVEPGGLILLHVHTAVATIARERFVTTSIVVGKLGARAVVDTPPGIVDVEATPVIEDSIVNRRRRIPVR